MEASVRPEVLKEIDHANGRRGDPTDDNVRQEFFSDGQSRNRNTYWPPASEEIAFESFSDGSGI
jgi:hypothetical protein